MGCFPYTSLGASSSSSGCGACAPWQSSQVPRAWGGSLRSGERGHALSILPPILPSGLTLLSPCWHRSSRGLLFPKYSSFQWGDHLFTGNLMGWRLVRRCFKLTASKTEAQSPRGDTHHVVWQTWMVPTLQTLLCWPSLPGNADVALMAKEGR